MASPRVGNGRPRNIVLSYVPEGEGGLYFKYTNDTDDRVVSVPGVDGATSWLERVAEPGDDPLGALMHTYEYAGGTHAIHKEWCGHPVAPTGTPEATLQYMVYGAPSAHALYTTGSNYQRSAGWGNYLFYQGQKYVVHTVVEGASITTGQDGIDWLVFVANTGLGDDTKYEIDVYTVPLDSIHLDPIPWSLVATLLVPLGSVSAASRSSSPWNFNASGDKALCVVADHPDSGPLVDKHIEWFELSVNQQPDYSWQCTVVDKTGAVGDVSRIYAGEYSSSGTTTLNWVEDTEVPSGHRVDSTTGTGSGSWDNANTEAKTVICADYVGDVESFWLLVNGTYTGTKSCTNNTTEVYGPSGDGGVMFTKIASNSYHRTAKLVWHPNGAEIDIIDESSSSSWDQTYTPNTNDFPTEPSNQSRETTYSSTSSLSSFTPYLLDAKYGVAVGDFREQVAADTVSWSGDPLTGNQHEGERNNGHRVYVGAVGAIDVNVVNTPDSDTPLSNYDYGSDPLGLVYHNSHETSPDNAMDHIFAQYVSGDPVPSVAGVQSSTYAGGLPGYNVSWDGAIQSKYSTEQSYAYAGDGGSLWVFSFGMNQNLSIANIADAWYQNPALSAADFNTLLGKDVTPVGVSLQVGLESDVQ